MALEVSREGKFISRRRIIRLMKGANLMCRTKHTFKATTDSKHNGAVAPDLLHRKFKVKEQNRYWVGELLILQQKKDGCIYRL
ncbi:MAG: hypothetical protein KBC27_01705 [Rickettsiales bacterium]|nr:hypothetical protein [Rickettsiales bacterium]